MSITRWINGKLVHEVEHWEELLTISDPVMPLPDGITAEDPIHLYIGRPVLEAVLEDNIAAIFDNREELDQDGRADITDEMLEVRCELLAWVRAHPGINIFVSIYPVDEAPTTDEEGA